MKEKILFQIENLKKMLETGKKEEIDIQKEILNKLLEEYYRTL